MTDPYGIIDLAYLKKPTGAAAGSGGAAGSSAPGTHEVAVTEQGLEQLVADSQRIPTLLLVTSSRVPEGQAYLDAMRRAVDAKGGALRLATVDADTQQRVAAALRVQQLPTLMLLLMGQVQPIAEAVLPLSEIEPLLTQILDVARQQGMELPEAEGQDAAQTPAEEPLPPLVAEAYEAIEAGNFDAAVTAFEKQLDQTPADAEAKAGLATVQLMRRTQGVDLESVRTDAANSPRDLQAQLLAADVDMLGGHVDDAFGRLLDLLRGADQETKDAVRARLLELFEIAGSGDPRVAAARKRLANLLY
ncbi:co-chaperone YbbN [Brachybacterium sp. p3-SID957]|uniref:co-chaperone YbbN n=1 Tax=Brachybacterium sp. p3-SID957 TaxID=2916049 RepID=UPI00223C3D0C|nr:tetratricopeptide repeat protein [Brachybacterium sp. p3-SID957]MCT1774576.1 tetratricopeptide repeat protein [Brachybacterium sp. p3-SID957]